MSAALAVIEASNLPADVVQAEMDTARAFALAEKAPATRVAYKADFRDFTRWCGARGASPMPATPNLVSAYLANLATGGAKASTIGRKAAALRYAHKLVGFEPPTNAESVKAVVRGIRRSVAGPDIRDLESRAGHECHRLWRRLNPAERQRRQSIERAGDRTDRVGGKRQARPRAAV
jgi:integrase family protein with SAM-like domain